MTKRAPHRAIRLACRVLNRLKMLGRGARPQPVSPFKLPMPVNTAAVLWEGQGETSARLCAERLYDLKTAAGLISGVVIAPGRTLSLAAMAGSAGFRKGLNFKGRVVYALFYEPPEPQMAFLADSIKRLLADEPLTILGAAASWGWGDFCVSNQGDCGYQIIISFDDALMTVELRRSLSRKDDLAL